MPRLLRKTVATHLALAPLAAAAALAAPPTGFETETVLSGLDQPMAVDFLPDGRMLVACKTGPILIADPEADPVTTAPYLTVGDVNSCGESGLVNLAVDPNFAANPYIYAYYFKHAPFRVRIARFTHLGASASPSSEFLVWEDPDSSESCYHVGGGLDFGPDGAIYLTTGDETDGAQAQDLARAGGKVIRVNPDGTIPAGNMSGAVWALGLRNPFRASWDLPTGRLFIGEVGGNDQATAWEDIHLGAAGANFGWPACEGGCANPDFPTCTCGVHEDPLFAYAHEGVRACLIGGFVSRGTNYPACLDGAYFYGDHERQTIRYLTFDATGLVVTGDLEFDADVGDIVSLSEGPDGALYYVRRSGSIERVTYVGPSLTGDVDRDCVIGISDLLAVLEAWGPCRIPCPPACGEDVDGSCVVDVADLLEVLAGWSS